MEGNVFSLSVHRWGLVWCKVRWQVWFSGLVGDLVGARSGAKSSCRSCSQVQWGWVGKGWYPSPRSGGGYPSPRSGGWSQGEGYPSPRSGTISQNEEMTLPVLWMWVATINHFNSAKNSITAGYIIVMSVVI